MATIVMVVPNRANYFYELFMNAQNIGVIEYNEILSTGCDWKDPGIEFEAMDYANELAKAFEITDQYKDLEPCQPSIKDFDDRYRGKCKRLRKESRGW